MRPWWSLLPLLGGCWVLTERDLEEHDRLLEPTTPAHTAVPAVHDVDSGQGETGLMGTTVPECPPLGFTAGDDVVLAWVPDAVGLANVGGEESTVVSVRGEEMVFQGEHVNMTHALPAGTCPDEIVQLRLGAGRADSVLVRDTCADRAIVVRTDLLEATRNIVLSTQGPVGPMFSLQTGAELPSITLQLDDGRIEVHVPDGANYVRAVTHGAELGTLLGAASMTDNEDARLVIADGGVLKLVEPLTGEVEVQLDAGATVVAAAVWDTNDDSDLDVVALLDDGTLLTWIGSSSLGFWQDPVVSGGRPGLEKLVLSPEPQTCRPVLARANNGSVFLLRALGNGGYAIAELVGASGVGVAMGGIAGSTALDIMTWGNEARVHVWYGEGDR
ncbi:MAG: hypothetical protein H6735_28635 [Alphaproteobacteria bacterium]|nr:hypothetical protein [Alphaproteobacteria bacterium]